MAVVDSVFPTNNVINMRSVSPRTSPEVLGRVTVVVLEAMSTFFRESEQFASTFVTTCPVLMSDCCTCSGLHVANAKLLSGIVYAKKGKPSLWLVGKSLTIEQGRPQLRP